MCIRDRIVRRAKTFDKTLAENLAVLMRSMPQSRGEVIADKNWRPPSGKGTALTRSWMIKVTDRNHRYLSSSTGKKKFGTPRERGGGKELIYEADIAGKQYPVEIVFRQPGKLEPTKAGPLEQEQGSAFIFRQVLNSSGPRWRNWQDIVEDTPVYNRLLQIFDGDVPDEWLSSYFGQSEVIFKQYSPGPDSEFGDDIPDGCMGFISKVVKDNFDIVTEDDKIRERIEEMFRDINIENLLYGWVRNARIFGTGYLEWTGDNLVLRSSQNMYVKRNEHGQVEYYYQKRLEVCIQVGET